MKQLLIFLLASVIGYNSAYSQNTFTSKNVFNDTIAAPNLILKTADTTNRKMLVADASGNIFISNYPTSGGVGTTTNALTFNNSGSGDASGSTFNGSAAKTLSYNSIGAVPTTTTVNGHALSANVTVTAGDVGLGNVDNTSDATKNSATATLTNKRITSRTGTTASTSSLTIDSDSYDFYTVTALAANLTINNPTGTPTEGQKLIVRIKDNGTSRTFTWGANFRAGTDISLPTATTINKTVYVGFIWNATDSKWDCVTNLNGY